MKKFIETNLIAICILIILVFIFVLILSNYANDYYNLIDLVRNHNLGNPEQLLPLLPKEDAYNVFIYNVAYSNLRFIQVIFPFLVLIPGLRVLNKDKKSKLTLKMVRRSWGAALIIPLFLGIAFLISYLYAGHLNLAATLSYMGLEMVFPSAYYQTPLSFLLIYILNLLLWGIFFINIGLLMLKRKQNFLITILVSFLIITAYQIFTEVIIGEVLVRVFANNLFKDILSLSNYWVYEYGSVIFKQVSYALFLMSGSTLLVYGAYKNQKPKRL